jgi:hypothetical protein
MLGRNRRAHIIGRRRQRAWPATTQDGRGQNVTAKIRRKRRPTDPAHQQASGMNIPLIKRQAHCQHREAHFAAPIASAAGERFHAFSMWRDVIVPTRTNDRHRRRRYPVAIVQCHQQ